MNILRKRRSFVSAIAMFTIICISLQYNGSAKIVIKNENTLQLKEENTDYIKRNSDFDFYYSSLDEKALKWVLYYEDVFDIDSFDYNLSYVTTHNYGSNSENAIELESKTIVIVQVSDVLYGFSETNDHYNLPLSKVILEIKSVVKGKINTDFVSVPMMGGYDGKTLTIFEDEYLFEIGDEILLVLMEEAEKPKKVYSIKSLKDRENEYNEIPYFKQYQFCILPENSTNSFLRIALLRLQSKYKQR